MEYIEDTPEPLYNMVCYNTVLDITGIRVGPQMAISVSFSNITYSFYSRYNSDWIANTEIGLDHNNSVIKNVLKISAFSRVGVDDIFNT